MNGISIYKASKFVKKFENIIQNLYRSISGMAKVLFISKFILKFPKPYGKDCIILGNGPSLKITLSHYNSILNQIPTICVNNFALSKEFKIIKPKYYVMLDPGYFIHKDRPDIKTVFYEFKNNINWEMTLFVPHFYRKDADILYFQKANSFIKITFYNYTIVKGFDFFSFFLFRKNLAMPQFYNVLGASIYVALNMGYEKVWITGADHTWSDNIHIDNDNNLHRVDKHFYDKEENKSSNLIIDPISGRTAKIAGFFNAMYRIFDSYDLLNNYATYMNSKIYNASEFSYIDAFERKKLDEIDNGTSNN